MNIKEENKMIVVSVCLVGIVCRYDGKDKEIIKIK